MASTSASERVAPPKARRYSGEGFSRYADKPNYIDAYSRLLAAATLCLSGLSNIDEVDAVLPGGPCWVITETRNSTSGHSKVKVKMPDGSWRTFSGHKLSWLIHVGWTRRHLCHLCDVKNCINPMHLYAGSRSNNMVDAYKSGFIPAHTLFNAERNRRMAEIRRLRDLDECPF